MEKGVSARDMSLSIGQSESYINKIVNGKALLDADSISHLRGLIEKLYRQSDHTAAASTALRRLPSRNRPGRQIFYRWKMCRSHFIMPL